MEPATQPASENRRARKTAAAKRRYRNRIPKVGARELPLFRKNPRREEQFGIKSYVVCRECGAKRKKLNGNKWAHLSIHDLTEEQYCGLSGKWPGAPLICEALRRELSQRAKLQMLPVRGRPRLLKSVRGHTGEQPAPKWPMVCLLVEGHNYKQVGSDLNPQRFFTTVWAAARAMGFNSKGRPVANAFYDFGEPVTAEAVQALRKATGLSIPQFAKQSGIKLPIAAGVIRPRRKGQRIQPGIAKRVIAWRDDLIRQLLATVAAPARGEDRCSGSRILKTFFPDLKSKRGLLLRVMRWCRRSEPVTISMNAKDLGELFCAQAMLEVASGSRARLFAAFLPWAPDLIEFFQANLQTLKGRGSVWPLTDAAIAQRWGTTSHIVLGAWGSHVREIPPSEMRRLIEGTKPARNGTAPEGQRRRPGPAPYPMQEKAEYKIGKRVEEAVPLFEQLCGLVKKLPRRARTNPQKVAALLHGNDYSASQIEAVTHAPSKPLVASRWFISIETHLQFGVVAEYSRRFQRAVSHPKLG